MDMALLVKAVGGFFAIMNPFVSLPMFLSLTEGYAAKRQRRAALMCVVYCLILVGVILVSGTAVLQFFGIGIDQFRIAGGIVLMMIAIGMLGGGSTVHSGTPQEQSHQATQSDISFYPMAFPMIVGPGTITTIVVFTGQATDLADYLTLAAVLVGILALLLAVLWFAPMIGHHMSQTLRTIMTRLMGMILAAIAVEMIVAGAKGVFPVLAS